jgi:hypothetical protein
MKTICHVVKSSAVALLTLLLPCSLLAQPIIVTINDVPNAQPAINVLGAPNGYYIYTGEIVSDPTVEDGALIVLFGVNNFFSDPAPLPDWGGRFMDPTPWQALPPYYRPGDPTNYRQYRTAVDIVWIEHNFYSPDWHEGDLIVGFNSAFPGTWYSSISGDDNLGPVTDNWVTVYASDVVVVRYKPHTYVAKGYVPLNGSMELVAGPATPAPELPDNPNAFVREYTGTGNGTLMGTTKISMKLTVYPDQGTPYTDPRGYPGVAMPYAGSAVLTAADGSTLNCLVKGIEGLTEFPWWLEGDLQVTGGTGRFLGARGYMTFMGLDADTITVVFDGTISSVAKRR